MASRFCWRGTCMKNVTGTPVHTFEKLDCTCFSPMGCQKPLTHRTRSTENVGEKFEGKKQEGKGKKMERKEKKMERRKNQKEGKGKNEKYISELHIMRCMRERREKNKKEGREKGEERILNHLYCDVPRYQRYWYRNIGS